jgi:glycosyltransferase involved in cell wall biosynthesis
LTHADALTVASRALESLVWAMGVPPGEVFYVPNGISSTRYAPKTRDSREPPIILLYTRFFEFPLPCVLDVFCRVREQIPQARLLVVGKGFFGEEEEFLHLAQEAGLIVTDQASRLTRDVIYTGWGPSDELPAYFALADVAIYPFADTLVNRTKCAVKLGDLLAAGVPVVAEAVGQNREYIRHAETGWLVQPGDVTAFADAVVQLLEDRSLRERVGRAAARDVRERFAWDRLVEMVERAYKRR